MRNGRPFGVSLDDRGVDQRTLFYEKPLFIKLLAYGSKQVVKQLALAQCLAEAYESGLVRGLRKERKAAKFAEDSRSASASSSLASDKLYQIELNRSGIAGGSNS